MIDPTPLGRLGRVDLRAEWTYEAIDFTPRLAAEASIALLGEAIRLELAVQREEARVGPFRADLPVRDAAAEAGA